VAFTVGDYGPVSIIVEEPGADGRPIRIEVEALGNTALEDIYGTEPTRGPDGKLLHAGKALFDDALDLVETCAATVAARLGSMSTRPPDEVELQLAIKVDGKVGARIVEVAAGAHMQVTLRWKAPAIAS
jgi:hypothetical protein